MEKDFTDTQNMLRVIVDFAKFSAKVSNLKVKAMYTIVRETYTVLFEMLQYMLCVQPNSHHKRIVSSLMDDELHMLTEVTQSCDLTSTLLPVRTVGVQVRTH